MKRKKKQRMAAFQKRADALLGILYPRRCAMCDEIVSSERGICPSCERTIQFADEPVCKKCGKPLDDERKEFCRDCQRKQHFFTQGKAVFVYAGKMKRSMYRFKYANKREYAEFYAAAAAENYRVWLTKIQPQAIIPVPMYVWKKRLRGYNQAEIFARALGRKTGIFVDERLIRRVRDTIPQKQLTAAERKNNLKNAFQLVFDIVEYKKVLLVDDIYTTGSTMDEISKILKDAGVREIYYLCISIGEDS